MTPYERLMAEALPTGTFGHADRAHPRRPTEPASWWTSEEQAAHVATLEAELDQIEARGTGKPRLRIINGEAA
ncbi:hypothetical protein ACIQNU_04065 [Streptomyces sp. NPDC091292]|uniref:hypothetical protein n=1 Tax=Streptomyces sp. NPDC091292 TaxID=3365991 RepID=UPI00381E3DE8